MKNNPPERDAHQQPDFCLPGRVQPNSPDCRARDAGFGDYADCLVRPDLACSYALTFGAGFLCMHPARAEIAARTPKPSPETPGS